MKIVLVLPTARKDLDREADYLAERSADSGRRFYAAARATFTRLAEFPGLGSPLTTPRTSDLRVWRIRGFPKQLTFYRETPDSIEIVRVLHAARDWQAILEVR